MICTEQHSNDPGFIEINTADIQRQVLLNIIIKRRFILWQL